MKKIKITTPENIEVEYSLAGLASRTAAAAIDSLVQFAVLLLLGIAIILIVRSAPEFWGEYYGWIIGISLIIFALISYGYFIAMELSMNGQTLGKKVLKLRVIRNNGQPITLKHSAIRNLFRVFIDNFGVGIVLLFFTKENKRLGDYAASTIVVAEHNKEVPVTLEALMRANERYEYYLTKEEQELIREYYRRKNRMDDYSQLREELKKHFTRKFESMQVLNEFENFINEL
ncbi:RDD family protein [Clostridium sp. SYSU_GA19001]|uniref:RDD family protein n=1 Tax=Clostridium caldaquaticum TaxID=2940653 RepID=UPI0020776FF2|nr:RDD family protein [Clostridium caldaquaticum]MCM8710289.1 RDD family protein [Clostridium caldaquaticum]